MFVKLQPLDVVGLRLNAAFRAAPFAGAASEDVYRSTDLRSTSAKGYSCILLQPVRSYRSALSIRRASRRPRWGAVPPDPSHGEFTVDRRA